jgi:hypothetical protein
MFKMDISGYFHDLHISYAIKALMYMRVVFGGDITGVLFKIMLDLPAARACVIEALLEGRFDTDYEQKQNMYDIRIYNLYSRDHNSYIYYSTYHPKPITVQVIKHRSRMFIIQNKRKCKMYMKSSIITLNNSELPVSHNNECVFVESICLFRYIIDWKDVGSTYRFKYYDNCYGHKTITILKRAK